MSPNDPEPPTPQDLPRMVGPYRLEALLGRGGMGEAFRAWDERLGRHVAVKHVRNPGGERGRARFRREARTAAQLSHPSIVEIFDILEEPDGDWIVMELVAGRSLAEGVQEGPLGIDEVLAYGRQIAEGLAAAHRRGVIHRDLKTENVMVFDDPPGRVKILDFGLAKQLVPGEDEGSLSVEGQVMGTARTMSPEQAQGLPVDERSDLFSFGVLLYEIATGRMPFQGESFYETLQKVVSETPPPAERWVPSLPPELSALIDRLLQKAPELRPLTASQVAEELRRMAESSTASGERALAATEGAETWLGDDTAPLPRQAVEPKTDASSPGGPGLRRTFAVLLGILAILAVLWGAWRLQSDGADGPDTAVDVAAEETDDPVAAYHLGMDLLRNYHRPGAVDRAVAVFQELLAKDERSAPAHAGLARAYWRKAVEVSTSRDPVFLQQARAVAEEAVRLDEFLAAARISRALVSTELGLWDEAQADLELAQTLDPTSAEAHYALGRLWEARGRSAESIEAYRRAVATDPKDRRFYDSLGQLFFRLGRYDEAEQMFAAGIERAPDSLHGYRNLAAVHHVRGDYGKAAALIQNALKIRPDSSLYSNLGYLFFVQGLYVRSASAYEKALEMAGASNYYVYWANLADAYRQLPDRQEEARTHYARAVQLLDEELERKPGSLPLVSRGALYRAKMGQAEEAARELDALEMGEDPDPQSLFRLAVTYELAGRRDQALETLGKALVAGFSKAEVEIDPELRELRSDPEYHRLLMRLGPTDGS